LVDSISPMENITDDREREEHWIRGRKAANPLRSLKFGNIGGVIGGIRTVTAAAVSATRK